MSSNLFTARHTPAASRSDVTVLVTGSTGMLGRALCGLLQKNHTVLGLSRHGADGTFRCDLSDESALRRVFEGSRIDFVVNTAAYSEVDGCERDAKMAYEANALACKNLSVLCGARKIPWVHVSTDYVFDGRGRAPYKEDDPTGPVNIYGLTKWIGEYYAASSEAPCAIVRTSWLFGGPNPKNFVNWVITQLAKEDVVSVLDDQMDAPTSVKDLSLAILKVIEHMKSLSAGTRWNETFHVCNNGSATRLQMTEVIRDAMGRKGTRVARTDPAKIPNRVAIRPAYVVMSPKKFEKNFGVTLRPWQESLKEYIHECVF